MCWEKDIPLFFDPTEESNVYILLPLDAIVSVMEDLGDWFRVSYNDCTGFIPPEYIELLKYDEAFETYGVVDAEEMSLLEEADGSSEVLATLKDGDRVEVTGLENGYFAVKSGDQDRLCHRRRSGSYHGEGSARTEGDGQGRQ